MARTLVIAEPGCTHEGSKGALLRLLREAKACDADVFKPQWTSNPERMCKRRHIGLDHPKRDCYLRAYSWLNFPVEWHAEISAECHALGMQYAVTCFLPEDVATVAPYADILKIASFENGDDVMWRAMTLQRKPFFVSNGMLAPRRTNGLLGWVLRLFPFVGRWAKRFIQTRTLQCVSAYPAPVESINLAVIRARGLDGLSDHSRDIDMGAFAVCAGAQIIETHYRLYDCDPENPDYPVAFDPGEFAMYVAKVRKAERALGSGVKRVQPSEEWALPYRVTA